MKWSLLIPVLFCTVLVTGQTYIRQVTVVDVEKNKLIPDQTVVITDQFITAIKPSSKIKIPADASVIEGKGKFLLPGLTDAHVHFFQSGGLYTRPDAIDLRKYRPYENEIAWTHTNMEDLLRRYLQTGITTVIDPGTTVNFLRQRDTFINKKYAPAVYMSGPLLTTYEPVVFRGLKNDEPFNLITTPEEARAAVQQQIPYKPDFIKIWYIVRGKSVADTARKFEPLVKAAIEEAHKNNLKVAVHATERITAQLAVESGCDYLVHDVEDEVVSAEFVELLRSKRIVLCPTLTVMDGYLSTFAQKRKPDYDELVKTSAEPAGSLLDLKHIPDTVLVKNYKQVETREAAFNRADSIRRVNLKKLIDGGVTIASGTDAGNIGTLHATSYFQELKAMQQAGLSNWQILQASTLNGAKVLGKEKETGSISVGKKADLLLLNADPGDSLENLKKISLVINKGMVIAPDTLVKETPVALAQRQLTAYNLHDIEAFLEPYADDVELYQYPSRLISKGKEEMRKSYGGFFNRNPDLHAEVTERISQGNIVIDKEKVTLGNRKFQAVAIYHIEQNKIKKVYFIQ